jgi:hypothetical protein
MAKKNLRFDSLIAKGENPNGMIAQTADETVRGAEGLPPQDWKYGQQADGRRWNGGRDYSENYGAPVAVEDKGHNFTRKQSFPPQKTR